MLEVFVLSPKICVGDLRHRIDQRIGHSQFMIVGQLRGDVGHYVVDGSLLELGESGQRQFAACSSFVQ